MTMILAACTCMMSLFPTTGGQLLAGWCPSCCYYPCSGCIKFTCYQHFTSGWHSNSRGDAMSASTGLHISILSLMNRTSLNWFCLEPPFRSWVKRSDQPSTAKLPLPMPSLLWKILPFLGSWPPDLSRGSWQRCSIYHIPWLATASVAFRMPRWHICKSMCASPRRATFKQSGQGSHHFEALSIYWKPLTASI